VGIYIRSLNRTARQHELDLADFLLHLVSCAGPFSNDIFLDFIVGCKGECDTRECGSLRGNAVNDNVPAHPHAATAYKVYTNDQLRLASASTINLGGFCEVAGGWSISRDAASHVRPGSGDISVEQQVVHRITTG
jgi:hypothetical protein